MAFKFKMGAQVFSPFLHNAQPQSFGSDRIGVKPSPVILNLQNSLVGQMV